MYKTIIVEDEAKNAIILKKLLQEYCPMIDVVGVANDNNSAYELITEVKPDLVFLDIVMPYGNAFELLNKLTPVDFEIIFVTAHDNYAITAIKYSAFDYLLKPISIDELQTATKNVLSKISNKNVNNQLAILMGLVNEVISPNTRIAVPTVDGFVFVIMENIIRLEANGSYTFLFTTDNEKIVASRNIKEYEDFLPKNLFFRIHNSHLINLKKLLKYNKGRGGVVIMEDGTHIEVAIRRKAEFLNKFQ